MGKKGATEAWRRRITPGCGARPVAWPLDRVGVGFVEVSQQLRRPFARSYQRNGPICEQGQESRQYDLGVVHIDERAIGHVLGRHGPHWMEDEKCPGQNQHKATTVADRFPTR
jgi:hypothetical protein